MDSFCLSHVRSQRMPMNRIQFQSGLSLAEFLRDYGSEEQCEAAEIGRAHV